MDEINKTKFEMPSVMQDWLIAILSTTLLFLSVWIVFYSGDIFSFRAQTQLEQKGGNGPVSIMIDPNVASLKVNEEGMVDIYINTSGEEVTAVDMRLSFDSNLVQIDDISPGDFFENPNVLQEEIQNGGGKIIFIIGGPEGKTGEGKLATIKIRPVKKGNFDLIFEKGSQVSSKDKTENFLGTTRGAVVNIQ